MNAASIRIGAFRTGIAAALLSSLIALGLVACGGGSSNSSSSSGSSGGGGSGGSGSTATYAVLYSMGSASGDAQGPDVDLIQGSDGNLYGTTYSGGTQSLGTVFKISPSSGAETVLYSFGSVAGDGANPAAALIQGSDGNLYGTAYAGGADSDGIVFALSPSTGTETILHSFAGTPSDGAGPGAVLLQGSDGNLYGTTLAGGSFKDGTIYRIAPSGSAEVVLYSFGTGINDGQDPDGSGLIQGSDGNFYGTTLEGGAHGAKVSTGGTIFMYSPTSGTETVLYSFGSFSGDGAEPGSGLMLGSDGNFYGTTSNGGTHAFGTAFKFSPSSGTETVLYSFGNFSGDGESPVGGLIQTSNGTFYGTTSAGGANGSGTVYDFTVQ